MIAYQLHDEKSGWSGYYIWTNQEIAQEMCETMNKDRINCGLKPTIEIKTVEIK